MTTIAISNFPLYSFTPKTQGTSGPVKIVDQLSKSILSHFRTNISNEDSKTRLINALLLISKECCSKDWDGYGAEVISDNTLDRAFDYTVSLSPDILSPEISPEPDGELALEWYGNHESTISISVGSGDMINYSAFFPDGSCVHGSEKFDSKDKEIIEIYIRRVTE